MLPFNFIPHKGPKMHRLLIPTLLSILLLGCSDEEAVPRPKQTMEVEKEVPSTATLVPQSNTADAVTNTLEAEPQPVASPPLVSKSEPKAEQSSSKLGQVKQKTRAISSSLASSTKDWRKKWGEMNKNRIESDNVDDSVTPQQQGDTESLKRQYSKVKRAVIDTSKAAVDKVNQMTE